MSVLMVGHGGWLREFMTYLATQSEKLNPISSSGYHHLDFMKVARRICPNTAVSKFQIALDRDGQVTGVDCLSLHDRSHLMTNSSGNMKAVLREEMAV